MTRRNLLALALAPAAGKPDPARAVWAEVNRARVARGLAALEWNDMLAAAARQHTANMVRRGVMSHDDPELGGVSARLTRYGIPWRACAENLFQEEGYPDPTQIAVRSWLNSPGHRRNMLSREYTLTGVGVATGSGGTVMMTQIFVGV